MSELVPKLLQIKNISYDISNIPIKQYLPKIFKRAKSGILTKGEAGIYAPSFEIYQRLLE
jgi:hypothetical protein